MLGRLENVKGKLQYAPGGLYGNVTFRKENLKDYQKACKSKMIVHLNHIALAC